MSIIYVLKLEGENYYVGRTSDLNGRFQMHVEGTGSEWTRKWKPLEIIDSRLDMTEFMELATTLTYMKMYGIDKVRGAEYSQIKLSKNQIKEITRHINHELDLCLHCGSPDHFIRECPEKGFWSFFACFKCTRKKPDYYESEDPSEVITFGKHYGKSYQTVWQEDKAYCRWVMSQKSKQGEFIRFQKWCYSKND